MNLKERIKGKRVLFIPVFSMRDRKTGVYNLENDGNYARVCSLLANAEHANAIILLPDRTTGKYQIPPKTTLYHVDAYKFNAHATRWETTDFLKVFINELDLNNFDIIVSEPNAITQLLSKYGNNSKLIYWCVASITDTDTPWFVKEFEEIDKDIASRTPTAVASIGQVEGLKGKAYLEESFYDASLFDYQTIFFPFRLTDENYRAGEFANIVRKLSERTDLKPFKVLYTDINNSGIFDDNKYFVKISGDHDTYLQVLKGRPIIPYLENMDVLEHISINEFIYYHCEVIAFNCRHKKDCDNIIYVNTFTELYESLVNKLKKESIR